MTEHPLRLYRPSNGLRLYRPSNGTEGAAFHERWCCNCAKDAAMREGKDFDDCDDSEKCQIIADTFAYDVTDPKYPKEWRYDERGYPVCTAFEEFNGHNVDRRETWQKELDRMSGKPTDPPAA